VTCVNCDNRWKVCDDACLIHIQREAKLAARSSELRSRCNPLLAVTTPLLYDDHCKGFSAWISLGRSK
jgi:hypothetical protein